MPGCTTSEGKDCKHVQGVYIFFFVFERNAGKRKITTVQNIIFQTTSFGFIFVLFCFYFVFEGNRFFFSEILNFDPQRFGKPM